MFPLRFLTVENIKFVTGLERGRFRGELAIFGNAATDTSAESEVNRATGFTLGFVHGGEVSVVCKKNRAFEETIEESGKIEIAPVRKIGGENWAIILNDTRESDGDNFDIVIFGEERLEAVGDIRSEFIRVGIGKKTEFLLEVAKIRKKHDLCFSATDVDSEIHVISIAQFGVQALQKLISLINWETDLGSFRRVYFIGNF